MENLGFYRLDEILSKKDLNNEEPDIYLISLNRTAGKTTAVLKEVVERFLNLGQKAMIVYRQSYEICGAHLIFEDIFNIWPDLGRQMTSKSVSKGLFYELFLDDQPFGYAVSLHNPDVIKKYSPLFADVWNMVLDEFQTESGRYLKSEVEKLMSLYISVARGRGTRARHVKLFMMANNVSIMNPYFIALGIYKRIKENTHFIRGDRWICEIKFNDSAAEALQDSSIIHAFKQSSYADFGTQNVYLHDDTMFLQQPSGKSKYMFTLKHGGNTFGVRDYFEEGYLYISKKFDPGHPNVLTFSPGDHNQTTIMLSHYSETWKYLREAFQKGFLRFDDMKAKNVIFDILAIDMYK